MVIMNQRMAKFSSLLLVFVLLSIIIHHGRSVDPVQPQVRESFKIKTLQAARSCSYTLVIKTACSSPTYTRDQISLAFGDSYGNEVYVKRLDDPSSRIFERCSTDKFQITGPCTYNICYQYFLRRGSDGWKPEYVKINRPNSKAVNYYYNTFLPNGVWYGYNQCNGVYGYEK